jgi:hypothetical protein
VEEQEEEAAEEKEQAKAEDTRRFTGTERVAVHHVQSTSDKAMGERKSKKRKPPKRKSKRKPKTLGDSPEEWRPLCPVD